MIIDPLLRQLEGSVSDSTVQRHAERREEGHVEMFPLQLEKVSPRFLPLHLSARGELKQTNPLLLTLMWSSLTLLCLF